METYTDVIDSTGGVEHEYSDILQFAKTKKNISYKEFDACLLRDVRLFDVPNDDYFRKIEEMLDDIIRSLPAIKRIFAKPIIRLKDTNEIVPVEMAHVINNGTVAHLSVHSELWEGISESGDVIPKKLMTVVRTETYAIYENIIFSRVVDALLKRLVQIRLLLIDVLYNSCDIHFNLLDRTHHSLFFLALGKLYSEYTTAQEQHYSSSFRCVEKIRFIERTLRSKLRSPVYIHCKKRTGRMTLKKTNIFRVHKDYNKVYLLAEKLTDELCLDGIKNTFRGMDEIYGGYKSYVSILSVFAAGHFNFSFSEEQKLDFSELDAICEFRSWRMNIRSVHVGAAEALLFHFKKDKEYTVCVIIGEKKAISATALDDIKKSIAADEYLFANSREYGEKDVVYLSLFNMDSFRRLQQMFLRGMIYSDEKREDCPFCGYSLENKKGAHECPICSAEIKTAVCPETNEQYFLSGIKKHTFAQKKDNKAEDQRRFLHDRYLEASLHFRNIAPIADGDLHICPKCGKRHK